MSNVKNLIMKKLPYLIPVIVFALLTGGCSKSLTDLGYVIGEVRTMDATCVGPDNYFPQDDYPTPATNLVQRYTYGSHPNSNTRGWRGTGYHYYDGPTTANVNLTLLDSISRNDCVVFLRKFYNTLLSDKFNAKKFSKKYSPLCIKEVMDAVKRESQNSPYCGWHIFMTDAFVNNTKIDVRYIDSCWYRVTLENHSAAEIYVQVIMLDITKSPIITGIRYTPFPTDVTAIR